MDLTQEQREGLERWVEGRKGYRILERLPGEDRGRFLFQGSLEGSRAYLDDYLESDAPPDGTLLYLVKPYSGGVYEGYEVVGGKLVKGYRKSGSRRVSRGGYSKLGWGTETPEW